MRVSSLLLSTIPATLGASISQRQASVACNNSPDLCYKSYSEITHLGAHDSPFLRNTPTGISDSGNQNVNTTAQLNAGVRLLTAQVHNNRGSWDLCHTDCLLLDAGNLVSWLGEIKRWMDNNPNDVVTVLLVNSDNASAQDLDTQFRAAQITSYAYTPPTTTTALQTWPTLQQLITANTRLVTFVASLDPATTTSTPYLLDQFTFIFENPFATTSPTNFTCAPFRPPTVQDQPAAAIQSGLMPLMNHFLYSEQAFGIQIPNVAAVNATNAPEGGVGNLGSAATNCKSVYGKAPTFILVDFFDQGPAIQTVDTLNGVTAPVGRVQPQAAAAAAAAVAVAAEQGDGGSRLVAGKLFWAGGVAAVGSMMLSM